MPKIPAHHPTIREKAIEIRACRPWLESEIAVVQPRAIIRLGSTAAQAVIDPKFKVKARRAETQRFINDLKKIRNAIEK